MQVVLEERYGVPGNVIATGAIWLLLGIYRRHRRTFKQGGQPVITRAQGLMQISLTRCIDIENKAQEIQSALGLRVLMFSMLWQKDVESIQLYMIRTWFQHLCHSPVKHKPVNIWPGCRVSIDSTHGTVRVKFGHDVLFLAFKVEKTSGTVFGCFATTVPWKIVRIALEASGISLCDLEAY
ncbi:hypothetical protein CSAL01_10294 [Colletotrichum salicis]|uniref:Uncharacterized protein n=1 Tax=Colletotrichum salicis TaxID=1209931 RepID=A0A135UGQ3_9PEZI|nr:hypothetical protein CSAL01_10294 [Colletotrichum salicis]